MKYRNFATGILPLVLSACGSITLPAAVKLDSGEALVGTTTAAVSGGTFQVANPTASTTCTGNYDALDTRPVIAAPFTCTDGRYGTVTVYRSPNGMDGTGLVNLADGNTGRVAFGRSAARVLTEPSVALINATAAAAVSVPSVTGTGNCPTPGSIAADGKRCGARASGGGYITPTRPRRPSMFRQYHTGPRGGCYYLTASGNKSYVDRSMCR